MAQGSGHLGARASGALLPTPPEMEHTCLKPLLSRELWGQGSRHSFLSGTTFSEASFHFLGLARAPCLGAEKTFLSPCPQSDNA